MLVRPFVCLAALPLVSAQHERRLNDPVRVRIPDFSITLSPANPDLTTIDAKEVRDVAETMFEEYLETSNAVHLPSTSMQASLGSKIFS